MRGLSCCLLEFETGSDGVLVKHADRIEREFIEVFPSKGNQLSENIVRNCNDMATACGGLKDIKHLTNARPEELSSR